MLDRKRREKLSNADVMDMEKKSGLAHSQALKSWSLALIAGPFCSRMLAEL